MNIKTLFALRLVLASSLVSGALAQTDFDAANYITATAGSGVINKLSHDGQYLYHARGSVLYKLRATKIEEHEICGRDNIPIDLIEMSRDLKSSVTCLYSFLDDKNTGPGGEPIERLIVGVRDQKVSVLDTVSLLPLFDLPVADPMGAPAVDPYDLQGRWCFDVTYWSPGDAIVAVLGRGDQDIPFPGSTQVVYWRLDNWTYLNTVDVTAANGSKGGTRVGYALEVFNARAYVAMGAGGITQVHLGTGAVKAGLDLYPTGYDTMDATPPQFSDEQRRLAFGVRDLALVGDRLFAAGSANGLLEYDLGALGGGDWSSWAPEQMLRMDLPVTPLAHTQDSSPLSNYPIRVEAIENRLSAGATVADRVMVVVATAPRPAQMFEWGPWYQHSNHNPVDALEPYFPGSSSTEFLRAVQPPGADTTVDDVLGNDLVVPLRPGQAMGLFVVERESDSGPLEIVSHLGVSGSQGRISFNSLAFHHTLEVGDCAVSEQSRFWVFGSRGNVWEFCRGAGGGPPIAQPGCTYDIDWADPGNQEKYSTETVELSAVGQSMSDPSILIVPIDGNDTSPMHYARGTSVSPGFGVIGDTEGTEHFQQRYFGGDSWLDPSSASVEWIVTAGENAWEVDRLQTDILDQQALGDLVPGGGGFENWDNYYIPYPEDPQHIPVLGGKFKNGRSFGFSANDERASSTAIALGRSGVRTGIAVYDRGEIMSATQAAPCAGGLDSDLASAGEPICVTPGWHLDPHPNYVASGPVTDGVPDATRLALIYHMYYFDHLSAGESYHVLGVAAGSEIDPASSRYGEPKLAFFDMTNCTDPLGGYCEANTENVVPPPPGEYTTLAYAGSGRQGQMVDFVTRVLNGITYAFACDTGGRVYAFDLTNLFDVGAGSLTPAAVWEMDASPLDGLTSLLTQIIFHTEVVNGVPEDYLYVAAQRSGLIKLKVTAPVAGAITLTPEDTILLPGQATGVHIGTFPVAGIVPFVELMHVVDHYDGGLRMYR